MGLIQIVGDQHSLVSANEDGRFMYIYVIMCANFISKSVIIIPQSILREQGQNRGPHPNFPKSLRLVGLRRNEMASSSTSGSSVSAFLWSLVVNGLIFLAFFVGFLLVCRDPFFHVRKKILTSRFFSSGKSTSESMNRERSLELYLKSTFI